MRDELINSVMRGDIERVRMLIDKGADVNTKDNAGCSILILASNDEPAIAELLLAKGANPNATFYREITSLMVSAIKCWPRLSASLISKGVIIDAKDERGYTALNFACKQGCLEIAKLLLDNGANPDNDADEYNPLTYAASAGNKDILDLILERKANVNRRDSSGQTALMRAALAGHNQLIEILINSGAEIELKATGKYEGQKAFSLACDSEKLDAAELLLPKLSDSNLRS